MFCSGRACGFRRARGRGLRFVSSQHLGDTARMVRAEANSTFLKPDVPAHEISALQRALHTRHLRLALLELLHDFWVHVFLQTIISSVTISTTHRNKTRIAVSVHRYESGTNHKREANDHVDVGLTTISSRDRTEVRKRPDESGVPSWSA